MSSAGALSSSWWSPTAAVDQPCSDQEEKLDNGDRKNEEKLEPTSTSMSAPGPS